MKTDCICETPRLLIRKFRHTDAEALYRNHSEAPVKKWIPNESYADIREAEDAVGFYISCADKRCLPYVLAVELKKNGELIGDTGINEVDGKPDEVEIGYCVCEKYSGRGFATEIVEAMTRFAAENFGVRVLYGRVLRGNTASVKVLEKNGFVFAGEEYGAEDDPYGDGMLVYRKEL